MSKIIICWLCIALISGCTLQKPQEPQMPQQNKTPDEETAPAPEQSEGVPPPQMPSAESIPEALPPQPPPAAEVLAITTFETPILDYNKNRINNIRLACKAMDGMILQPGEEFSFNTVVGERTAKKGYKEAVIFRDKEKVKELGGGICQLSSTLFGAAKAAGMEITARTAHQLDVDYVKKGEDATVFYGSIDFKFINTLDKQLKINASCGKGKVAVTLTPIA